MEKRRVFWPAGSKAIAKVDPSVTASIRPLDNEVANLFGFAKRKVDSRMTKEANRAEEAKGRKDQDKHRVGRKGESLETEDELADEL